jgi:hypothetical protein
VKSGVANVFALRSRRTGALVSLQLQPDTDIPEDFNIIRFPIDPGYTRQGTLDGKVGLANDPHYPNADQERGSYFKPREAADLAAQIEAADAALAASFAELDAGQLGRRNQGVNFGDDDPATDPAAVLARNAPSLFDFTGDRSKRNLVNTYVWNADGGLFSISEQIMATRTESSGGNYKFTGLGGAKTDLSFSPGIFFEAKGLFGGHIDASVSKSRNEGRSFGLVVELPGVESFLERYVITDPARPTLGVFSGEPAPGKVVQYRFKTFYLAPDKDAFDRFFRTVVDPDWLASSTTREAAALREARSQRNEVWRVLHRVTFVDRVPPRFDSTPDLDADEPERTVINEIGNWELARLVAGQLADRGEPFAERIGAAVGKVMAAAGSPLAANIPWWSRFAGEQPAAFARLHEIVFSYMKAYFAARELGSSTGASRHLLDP